MTMIYGTFIAALKYVESILFSDITELNLANKEINRLRKQNEWLKRSMETMIETNNRTLSRSMSSPVISNYESADLSKSWWPL
jgi:hypothetical protein